MRKRFVTLSACHMLVNHVHSSCDELHLWLLLLGTCVNFKRELTSDLTDLFNAMNDTCPNTFLKPLNEFFAFLQKL